MEIVFSKNALFLADVILTDSRSLFGEKAFTKMKDAISLAIKRIEWSPRYGSLEPALADEEGEYRFVLLNKRFKMVYKIEDENHISILAIWDVKQNPNNMRLYT